MTNVQAMSDLLLAMRLAGLPAEERLWTQFDYQVRDEYDRRELLRDELRRAA